MANAWHLRNDGVAFPVQVHLYPMEDPDLSSEAEIAAFIIKTNSKDQDLAQYTLDGFMALLLENERTQSLSDETSIEEALTRQLSKLPFKFAYPLTVDELIQIHRNQDNYRDLNSTLDFINEVYDNLESIQKKISESFNQQFIRVRFGGKYNTTSGNNCIWFRIGSVNYNWDNVIYVFTADMRRKLHIEYITICRDSETDDVEEDYFYKAKDGTVYYMMPVDEFFEESHEKNPVFSTTEIGSGVIQSIRRELSKGNTILGAYDFLEKNGIVCSKDYRPYLFKDEIEKCWISASLWFEELATRTKMKISKLMTSIKNRFPEILDIDIDYQTRENTKGNPVGFELLCTLVSDHPKIDNVVINIASNKPLSTITVENLLRMFTGEYTDFIKFSKIKV